MALIIVTIKLQEMVNLTRHELQKHGRNKSWL